MDEGIPEQYPTTTVEKEMGVVNDDDDDEIMGTSSSFFWTKRRMKCSLLISTVLTLIALCVVVPIVVVTHNNAIKNLRSNAKLLKGSLWMIMGGSYIVLEDDDVDAAQETGFGESVDLSGDGTIMAVGSITRKNNRGIVQIREYTGTKWRTVTTIIGTELEGQHFGSVVKLSKDGTIVCIGGYGSEDTVQGKVKGIVQCYQQEVSAVEGGKKVDDKWVQIGDTIEGDMIGDQFGISLSLASDGKSFIVGADNLRGPSQERNGYARVYEYRKVNDKTKKKLWVHKGSTIYGLNNDRTGYAVAMAGNGQTICVGDRWYKIPNVGKRGRVRCFIWENNDWNILPHGDIIGTIENGEMGYSLALNDDGNILAVGNRNGSTNDREGYVGVFERNLNKKSKPWKQMGNYQLSVRPEFTGGFEVALNAEGNVLAWTARGYDTNGRDQGIVRVAQYQNKDWQKVGNDLLGDKPEDYFGESIALNDFGNIVVSSANANQQNEYVRAFTLQ